MSNKIKKLRTQIGLSQEQLGIRADVAALHVGRIERGVKCNRQTAVKIAAALNEKPETVFPNFKELRGW